MEYWQAALVEAVAEHRSEGSSRTTVDDVIDGLYNAQAVTDPSCMRYGVWMGGKWYRIGSYLLWSSRSASGEGQMLENMRQSKAESYSTKYKCQRDKREIY